LKALLILKNRYKNEACCVKTKASFLYE